MGQSLFAQQQSGQFCDLTLETESYVVGVHACVMAARSKLLAAALLPKTTAFDEGKKEEEGEEKNSLADSENGGEKLVKTFKRFRLDNDVSKAALSMMLEIAYTGQLTRILVDDWKEEGEEDDEEEEVNTDAGRDSTRHQQPQRLPVVEASTTHELRSKAALEIRSLGERLDMPDVISYCDKIVKKKARGRPKGSVKLAVDGRGGGGGRGVGDERMGAGKDLNSDDFVKTRRPSRPPAKLITGPYNGRISEVEKEKQNDDVVDDDAFVDVGDRDFYPYQKRTRRSSLQRPRRDRRSKASKNADIDLISKRRKKPRGAHFATKLLTAAFTTETNGDNNAVDGNDSVQDDEGKGDEEEEEGEEDVKLKVSHLFARVMERLSTTASAEAKEGDEDVESSGKKNPKGKEAVKTKQKAAKKSLKPVDLLRGKTNRREPRTAEERVDWQKCPYCSKFRGKKKGRFEFHSNFCRKAVSFCRKCKKPSLSQEEADAHSCPAMERLHCLKCEQTFSEKSALYEHDKIHLDHRAFACRFCPKRFFRPSHARGHEMHVHTKERRFKCTQCEMAFPLRYELTRHLKRHAEASFLCRLCQLSFTSQKQLNQHAAKTHRLIAENSLRPTPVLPLADRAIDVAAPNSNQIQIFPVPGVEHSYVKIVSTDDAVSMSEPSTQPSSRTEKTNATYEHLETRCVRFEQFDPSNVRFVVSDGHVDEGVTFVDDNGATYKIVAEGNQPGTDNSAYPDNFAVGVEAPFSCS